MRVSVGLRVWDLGLFSGGLRLYKVVRTVSQRCLRGGRGFRVEG